MKELTELISELEKTVPYIDHKNDTVSKVSVGWHLEHSLLAFVKMISATEHSNPEDFKRSFNWKRSLVFTMGKIPRGKARVPNNVKPGEEISEESIKPLLEKAKEKAELFEKLSSDKYFTHPVFGDLKIKQARRMIAIHTKHHIQIINDILKK